MTPSAIIPILLTSSAVAHDTGVALKDTQERIRLTLESIGEWLRLDPHLQIVVCDGSNYDFSNVVRARFPAATIECLHFENQQHLVRQYGRGYGEGEIVRHALDNSKLIGQAGCFAKCTAKLWVENFATCAAAWTGGMRLKGVFLDVFSPLKPTRFAYIDTRFYITNCKDYLQYFREAHHWIRKDEGYGLEECFHDVVLRQGLNACLFPVDPVICGVGGGTGVSYRTPWKRRLKERLRLWLVRSSREFAFLF